MSILSDALSKSIGDSVTSGIGILDLTGVEVCTSKQKYFVIYSLYYMLFDTCIKP